MRRPLAPVERLLWLISQRRPVNFVMTARIAGTITPGQLQRALQAVQARHPLLGVRLVVDPTSGANLISDDVPSIPLRVLARTANDSWISVLEDEVTQPFSWMQGPLVRCTLLQGRDEFDLIIVCAHAIADGLSGVYLIRDILQQLGEPSVAIPCLSELPPTEALIPRAATAHVMEMLRHDQSHGGEQARSPEPAPRRIPASTGTVPTRIIAWSLPHDATAALVKRCRAEQTTVHGAVVAAFLLTYAAQEETMGSARRRIQSPVNLRKRLVPPIDEDIGLFVTLMEAVVDCAPNSDLWVVARCVKQELHQIINSEQLFQTTLAVSLLAESRTDREMLEVLTNAPPVTYDLSVTNLGRVDLPVYYGALRLESIHGPALNTSDFETVLGITTLNGTMYFTLASDSSVMAANIRDGAMGRLRIAMDW